MDREDVQDDICLPHVLFWVFPKVDLQSRIWGYIAYLEVTPGHAMSEEGEETREGRESKTITLMSEWVTTQDTWGPVLLQIQGDGTEHASGLQLVGQAVGPRCKSLAIP